MELVRASFDVCPDFGIVLSVLGGSRVLCVCDIA